MALWMIVRMISVTEEGAAIINKEPVKGAQEKTLSAMMKSQFRGLGTQESKPKGAR